MLQRDVAVPGPYHAFFSFPVNKGGYSGVAVYTNSRNVVPLKAEEGLLGTLQPKPPLSEEERISTAYPRAHHIDAFPDEADETSSCFDALDFEGRTLVLDFGLFVLINVYCPAETSDARLPFKMNFHLLLQERVRKLIEEEHREVIVLGDINIAAAPLDHGDGHLPSNVATFWDHPARQWFRQWLNPNGPMIDVIRSFWPDRKGLFTCWNMKLQARETNYGARIDYVLITRGLLPWIKHGDIQASLKGSDHCPIFVDLHDEITLESGELIKLSDAMKQKEGMQAPRLSAKFWEEFSGKQTMLSTFFGKRNSSQLQTFDETTANFSVPLPRSPQFSSSSVPLTDEGMSISTSNSNASTETIRNSKPLRLIASAPLKRKPSEKSFTSGSTKKRKAEAGQSKIASFFSKPTISKSQPKEVIVLDEADSFPDAVPSCSPPSTFPSSDHQLDADYRLACELSATQVDLITQSEASQPNASTSQNTSKNAWSDLFAPLQPPRCVTHGEPAKLYTVNKQGPNKGKKFYICSRPVGPGYDKGKGERPRDEVNHQYRCNFFKWASDVKKEARQDKHRASQLRVGSS
ncbi:uncharacterized protein FIBRA_03903 [Fibroporia radiculosa]|uniref:DNA-(apurinic or apyrimidinic site) endonuclease n=1 Tax=Fibroporia radiculosa TaxID=599839 RepID=J4GNR2_9APHY|nr:uncharacterized protein FIBRA_03903 [Fibroporia radiculosa]CCM01835.1 predicted protein [Fibroporia radiculosa]